MEDLLITEDLVGCKLCKTPLSRKRGALTEFCKCRNFRIVRLKNNIDITNNSTGEILKLQYFIK